MIYRSKAPLAYWPCRWWHRCEPYSDEYGGAILNATISLSANASIELLDK